MELAHQAHEECYALVAAYLRQSFGELAEPDDEHPIFYVQLGRKMLRVGVDPVGDDLAVVEVFTWLGAGLPMTFEVIEHMLQQNGRLRFGALALDEDGDVLFHHSLAGEGLDKDFLATLIHIMADSADQLENELSVRFR